MTPLPSLPAGLAVQLEQLPGGLHSPAEGEALAALAFVTPASEAIVELGVYTGASALRLAAGARADTDAPPVVCVDPWPAPRADEPDLEHAARQRSAPDVFRANMAAAGWPVVALRSTAVDVAALWVQPVGLLFHDAEHGASAVIRDLEAWLHHLAPGAWVAVHDYLEGEAISGPSLTRAPLAPALDAWAAARQVEPVAVVDKLWVGRR